MTRSNLRLFIFLFVGFVAATVIGTLLHECGHYFAAKWLGYDAAVHYNRTSLNRPADTLNRQSNATGRRGNVENSNETEQRLKRESLYIRAGGPLQTMLTGSIAMIALVWVRKKSRVRDEWGLLHWTLVFWRFFGCDNRPT